MDKKKNIYVALTWIAVVVLTSCTSLQYTSLDVMRPAKVSFDPHATKLLIVNNTVQQPDDYGHRTELYNESPKNLRMNTDSLSLFCLSALNEEFQNNEFFPQVHLQLNSINKNTDFFTVTSLTPDVVDSLCHAYNADVILSLDRMKETDKLSEFFFSDSYSYYAALVVKTETQWSIHYPGKEGYESIAMRDTIYWDHESENRNVNLQNLPYRNDALVDASLHTGQSTVKKLVPYWEKVDRYFFYVDNNKQFKQGMDSLYAKKWESAIALWAPLIEKAGSSLKAELCHNIAVTYEIMGDIDKAVDYSIEAKTYAEASSFMSFKYEGIISEYMDKITNRQTEIAKLNQQLGDSE